MERMYVPLSKQLTGRQHKLQHLLKGEQNFMAKVLKQAEAEQKNLTYQERKQLQKQLHENGEEQQEEEHLVTKEERQA